MKLHTKTTLILLGTLVLGMVLGALLAGTFARHRFDRLADLRTRGGLARHVERTIQPRDSVQRRAIRQVLRRNDPRFQEARRNCRQNVRAAADSLRADLAPILTGEQLQRLDERVGRFRHRHPRKKRPPME